MGDMGPATCRFRNGSPYHFPLTRCPGAGPRARERPEIPRFLGVEIAREETEQGFSWLRFMSHLQPRTFLECKSGDRQGQARVCGPARRVNLDSRSTAAFFGQSRRNGTALPALWATSDRLDIASVARLHYCCCVRSWKVGRRLC